MLYLTTDLKPARALCDTRLKGTLITFAQVESAERTLDYLLEHPEQHQQNEWVCTVEEGDTQRIFDGTIHPEDAFDCGTAGCFAGFHALLNGKSIYVDSFGRPYAGDPADNVELDRWVSNDLGLPDFSHALFQHMFVSENTVDDLRVWCLAMRLRALQLAASAGESVPEPTLVQV